MYSEKSHFKSFYPFVIIILSTCTLVRGIGITFEQDVTLTLPQKRLLDKFKERVITRLPHEYMKTEINLIKWLRTSRFDVDLAESRILNDVEWRREHKMDTILDEDWSDMWDDDYRYYIEGRDNVWRSFMFLDTKYIDVRKAVIQGKGERMLRYTEKAYEEACTLVRTRGEKYGNMTRGHLLVNLDGYNNVQHACLRCLPFLVRMIFSYVEHWPECVDKIILVNSPATIQQFLEIARPLIDEVLRKSIFVYGTNKKVWMEALKEDFTFDQLPPVLGGTKLYKGMNEYDYFDL